MTNWVEPELIVQKLWQKYSDDTDIRLWRMVEKTSIWQFFDSSPELAEFNTLIAISKGDKLLINVLGSIDTLTQVHVIYEPPVLNIIPADKFSWKTPKLSDWSGQISKADVKELLVHRFGPVCWGCGFLAQRLNGTTDLTLLEVDHIRARKAAMGIKGDDELYNLAILHRSCNLTKGNRMTLEELRWHNTDQNKLYVESTTDLVDLFEANRFVAQELSRRAAKLGETAFLVLD